MLHVADVSGMASAAWRGCADDLRPRPVLLMFPLVLRGWAWREGEVVMWMAWLGGVLGGWRKALSGSLILEVVCESRGVVLVTV